MTRGTPEHDPWTDLDAAIAEVRRQIRREVEPPLLRLVDWLARVVSRVFPHG